jgi:hypothetical protein
MRIIQSFTKQHTKTMFGAILGTMGSKVTNEATTRAEEQIGVVVRQTGKGVKCETVHRHIDGGRKERLLVESNLVDMVVIRHGLLNYPYPSNDPLPYTCGPVIEVSLSEHQKTVWPWKTRG